jgi:hypothetical protein
MGFMMFVYMIPVIPHDLDGLHREIKGECDLRERVVERCRLRLKEGRPGGRRESPIVLVTGIPEGAYWKICHQPRW